MAPRAVTSPQRKPTSRWAWISLALSPVAFVIVMESVEALAWNGWFSMEAANRYFLPLVLLIPGTVVAVGVHAIRGGAPLAWVPTILGGIALVLLAVLGVLELLS